MAWAPSTSFEDDLVDLQPDFNLIHGQLAYEEKRKQEFTPRPKSTYEYLADREKRNEQMEKHSSKSKEIQASLAMMERIQAIAGTKPLGEHATMSDWDDTSTVEKEAIAMMRHFGMMAMTDGLLAPPISETKPPDGKIYVIRNGKRSFPLILDSAYFEPGKSRKNFEPKNSPLVNEIGNDDSDFVTANPYLDDTESSQEDHDYIEIPYKLLEESTFDETLQPTEELKKVKKKKAKRPSQSERREITPKNKDYNPYLFCPK